MTIIRVLWLHYIQRCKCSHW